MAEENVEDLREKWGIPRRNCTDKLTPVELKIREATLAVEELPADVRLTRAVTKLEEAADLVADFIEGKPAQSESDPETEKRGT